MAARYAESSVQAGELIPLCDACAHTGRPFRSAVVRVRVGVTSRGSKIRQGSQYGLAETEGFEPSIRLYKRIAV